MVRVNQRRPHRPVWRFPDPCDAQKNGQTEVQPMAPDFAELFRSVPDAA